jgi:hypothetical protein
MIAVILWLGAGNVIAQVEQTFPGARAMAMGGSFVGLADDASCMWYNPAGLAFIKDREAMIEAGVNAVDEYPPFGGEPSVDSEFNLRFLSLVGDARERAWNWGISAYRPWFSAAGAGGVIAGPGGFIREEQDIYRASLAIGRGFWPFEAAGEETSYRLAIGGSYDLNYSIADADSNVPGFSPEKEPSAFAEGYTVGVLLHLLEFENFGLKVGAAYHSDEELDFDFREDEQFLEALTWDVPEQFSVGSSVRISPYVTVTFTYEQIKWSDALPLEWYDDEERYAVGTEVLIPVSQNFTLPVRAGYTRSENDGNLAIGEVGGILLGGDFSAFDYTSEMLSFGTGLILGDRHFFDFAYGFMKLDRFDADDTVSVFAVSYAITF